MRKNIPKMGGQGRGHAKKDGKCLPGKTNTGERLQKPRFIEDCSAKNK